MSASPSPSEQPNEASAKWDVPVKQRWRYGNRMMEILATNNDSESGLHDYSDQTDGSSWYVKKQVFTVQNEKFARLYNSNIRPAIVQILKSELPGSAWVLNVLRLGFKGGPKENPIVVHFEVTDELRPEHIINSIGKASSLVDKIAGTIHAARWEGEKIYIDICRPSQAVPRCTSDPDDIGNNLLKPFSKLYDYEHPFPGFSIGPVDKPSQAGSFSGFITHTNEISGEKTVFGLTCEHVVNGQDSEVRAYRYDNGAKFNITMPAGCDHEYTRGELSESLREYQKELARLQIEKNEFESIGRSIAGIDQSIKETSMFEKHTQDANNQAKNYNINVGYLVATSGSDKSDREYKGTLDWAIFHYPKGKNNTENKYYILSVFDEESSKFKFGKKTNRYIETRTHPNFIEDTQNYIKKNQGFKPIRKTEPHYEEIFFKVPSRSSGWKEAICNGIKTIKCISGRETEEWCFVTHSNPTSNAVSVGGDSGAPLIDTEYQPTAIIWADSNDWRDVTYATPISEIFKDIERRMGFKEGSVSYC